MRAHFKMCYMVTKFTKRNVKSNGKIYKNQKINTRFFVCRKSCKEEKVPRKIQCLHDSNHVSHISSKSKNISLLINLQNCGSVVKTTF
jgi:hypothetical protein